jgi:DNA processing protein
MTDEQGSRSLESKNRIGHHMQTNLSYWIATLFLPDVGVSTLKRWLQFFPSIDQIFTADQAALKAAGVLPKHIAAIKKLNWSLIEKELAWAEGASRHIVTLEDKAYPEILKQISYPPIVLYIEGNLEALNQTQLAIVGARSASLSGMQTAEQMAKTLVKAGLVITSGMAKGIDRASHEGALAGQGLTIGVAGTGLQCIYPANNKSLINNILSNNGSLVSEFPLKTPPKPMNFPRRNRIISGLSRGILVVEAALKSGSLITAKHALEQGKEVFAVPGSIHHPLSKGCHYLIREGAKLVETAADILEELEGMRSLPVSMPDSMPDTVKKMPKDLNLSTEEHAVYQWINHEMTPLDVIILRSGLTANKVSSILLRLELYGHIHSTMGGYVR